MHTAIKDDQWRKSVLPTTATIRETLANIDIGGVQFAMIVDAVSGKLVGSVTDGDIRRGLLDGKLITGLIVDVCNKNVHTIDIATATSNSAFSYMVMNSIHQLPIIDHNSKPVGLYVLHQEKPTPQNNQVVIMAGGRGIRLSPLTDNIPKPMLPIGGIPILEHIVRGLASQGFHDIIITTHYLHEKIEKHFGNGEKLNVKIQYFKETTPLGTAGVLSKLSDQLNGWPFIVINGDVLADLSYQELLRFHNESSAFVTLVSRVFTYEIPFGVLQVDGIDVISFEEKPVIQRPINTGIYVFSPSVVRHTPETYCDMPMLLEGLIGKGLRTVVFLMDKFWTDIGRKDDLFKIAGEDSFLG
jgi:dTDP-glucose pyrophosphorylase